jgi:CheY-like chemotaxis protein
VKDSGCGIAPDVLPRVFEPFVQESTSIARSQGGLGLGLPLVKGFAALHGGEISVTSDGRGKGCTFVVTLPRPPVHADAGGDRARAEKRAPASVLVGRRILVVEDNPDLREMLQMLLEEHGATVTVACDGQEGIDRALAHRPEIVLVDIGLPVLDGYQVATRLRQELGAKPILVAVSGFGQLEDRRQALDSGFDEHLVKPVILERLAAAVESTERRRRTY